MMRTVRLLGGPMDGAEMQAHFFTDGGPNLVTVTVPPVDPEPALMEPPLSATGPAARLAVYKHRGRWDGGVPILQYQARGE